MRKTPTPNNIFNCSLLSVTNAMDRYNLGRKSLMELSEAANAVIRIGRSIRIVTDKVDRFISEQSEKGTTIKTKHMEVNNENFKD